MGKAASNLLSDMSKLPAAMSSILLITDIVLRLLTKENEEQSLFDFMGVLGEL